MDQDFKPINYRRTNVRFKYSRAQDQLKGREYYHMPPLCSNVPVKINNSKKYQKEEQRITEIERSNRILFQKMRNIRLKKGPYSQPDFLLRKKSHYTQRHINRTADTINNDPFDSPSTQAIYPKPSYKQFQTLPSRPTKRYTSVPPIRPQKTQNNNQTHNQNMKVLYKCENKEIDGKRYVIVAYVQNGEFWLKADQEGGSVSNYMHMEMGDYKRLERFYLPNGIESLLEHIRIGEVIELKGIEEDGRGMEEKEKGNGRDRRGMGENEEEDDQ